MLSRILFIALALASPLVSALAAGQFQLDVHKNPSLCFLQCHVSVIMAVHNFVNTDDDPLGNNEAIGGNCANEPYINAMPACLIATCVSAPDVAYGLEFGVSWCAKAGVDVSQTLVLPDEYTKVAAKEYFQSQAYLSSAALSYRPSVIAAGVALTLAPMLALAL